MSDVFIDVESTTPEGSPAPNYIPIGGPQQQQQPQPANGRTAATPAQPAPDTSSILKALADMAKQSTAPAAVPSTTAPTNPLSNVLGAQSAAPAAAPPVPSTVDQASQQPSGQPGVNPYAGAMAAPFAALSNLAQNPAMMQPQTQSHTPTPLTAPQNPLAALLPQATAPPVQPVPTMGADALQQQLQLLQFLAAQGIPQEQWATALQLLTLTNNMSNMGAGFNNLPPNMNPWAARADSQPRDSRDYERDRDYMRSPPGYRRRSRSPGWDRRRDLSPPRRRDSPVYGEYHGDSPGRRGDIRGRRGHDYRQRSPPPRRRRTPSPPHRDPALPPPGPKLIEWDYSIGQGNIKGMSSTYLFYLRLVIPC